MKALAAVSLLGLSLLPFAANADLALKDYKAHKASGGQTWQEVKIYIAGVGNGISWANTALQGDKKALLFCQPEHLALNSINYLDMLESELQLAPNIAPDSPVEYMLLAGLQRTFPCKS